MRKDTNEPEVIEKNRKEKKKSFFLQKKDKRVKVEPVDEESGQSENAVWKLLLQKVQIKAVVVVIAAIVIAAGCIFFVNTNYNDYEVVEETGVKNASIVDYVPYQNSLLKFSRDGAVYVDEKGESVWNETFAMKMPAADVSGEYAAIADLNGNDVYVFNKEGKVSSTTMPYKICDIAVAGQGEFAVILEGEKENYINIYDKNGEQISEIQTTIDKSGYPMDIDLSEDGEKLFSTYLYLDGANAKNGLAAYNFGAVGQNENADRLMGGYQLEDMIVPKVEFLDNNTICAFGDTQFIIYTMKEKPSQKAVIVFEEEVQSVIYNSDYIGVVLPNKSDGKNAAPYILELYNTSGRKVMTQEIDFAYENVRMSKDEIVFTGGTECRIYTIKGDLKFSYVFQKNVKDMVPTGYSRRYIVLYDNGSEVIKLRHESKKE